MSYSVKQAENISAADAVTGLWRRNLHFAPDVDLDARLRWYYRDGPEGPGQMLLLLAGETAVGCQGIGVRRFVSAGRPEPMRVALHGDLAIDRKHRTLMPGLTLMRAGREAAGEFAFHYGFPNAAAAPLFGRFGYSKLGMLTRWVRVLRHAHYLERLVKHPLLVRAGGELLDGILQAEAAVTRAIAGRHLALEPLADTDERFDRLWEAAHRQWGMIAWRDAAFLRWRFLRSPGSRCELVALVERPTRRLRAYAVLEPIDGTFHLRDFLAAELHDLGQLIEHLVPYLYRRGAIAISVWFLGAPRVEALLQAHRFHARQSTRTVMIDAAPGAVPAGVEEWYLTDGDEDT
jgi:hypothetical protein